jgi:hypothetical protein
VAPEDASIAIMRGPHLIFFRNRAADHQGNLADLFHQARMYYEDRLAGGGFTRAFLTGAAGAGPHHAADVEQIRRTLQERLKTTIEPVDPRAAAGLTDRITAAPALPRGADTARRPDAAEPGRRRMIRTNLYAAVLQRAPRPAGAARVPARGRRGHGVQRHARRSALRSDTQLSERAARDEARAADLRKSAVRLRATVDPSRSSTRRSKRARPTTSSTAARFSGRRSSTCSSPPYPMKCGSRRSGRRSRKARSS